MRVRYKITVDTDFVPTLKFKTKLWVWLPDGQYFYLHAGHLGQWYQMYALYMDYPSQQAAMEAALNHVLAPNTCGPEKYRKMRFKEQVFTFTPEWKKPRRRNRACRHPSAGVAA